jgi:RNA polymerase sigma factor (sigma-70 family)
MVAVRTGAADVDLARRATTGDGAAFAELFDRWFDRAFDVAWHIVRNRDTAAEVAQDTFATAWQQIGTLRQPESFGGWVLRIARNKGLNRLTVEQRADPVGDQEALADHDRERRLADDPAVPVADRERDDLVWAASAALGEVDASLLSLHVRHGLGAPELADELGIAANTAHQRLFRLKQRLSDAIGAWILWRLGTPRCDSLRTLLANAGTSRFDRDAAAMITAHTRGCRDCDDRRTLALSPEAMFAATPLVAAAPGVKAAAASALAASGTPAIPASSASTGTETGTSGGFGAQNGGGEVATVGGPAAAGRWATRRRTMVVVGIVLVGVAGFVLATRGDETAELVAAPTDESTPVDVSSSTTAEAPTTTESAGPATSPATAVPAVTEPAPIVPSPVTTTAPPPAPPEPPAPPAPGPPVGSLRATRLTTGNCGDPAETLTTFTWTSTGATSARLGPAPDAATPVGPTGDHTACALSGSDWVLVLTGAGGTTTATATVP